MFEFFNILRNILYFCFNLIKLQNGEMYKKVNKSFVLLMYFCTILYAEFSSETKFIAYVTKIRLLKLYSLRAFTICLYVPKPHGMKLKEKILGITYTILGLGFQSTGRRLGPVVIHSW